MIFVSVYHNAYFSISFSESCAPQSRTGVYDGLEGHTRPAWHTEWGQADGSSKRVAWGSNAPRLPNATGELLDGDA